MSKHFTIFFTLAVVFVLLTITGQLFGQSLTQPSPNLPPPPGRYLSTQLYWQSYANGFIFKDVTLYKFTQSLPPPPPGGTQVHNVNAEILMQASYDGGATFNPVVIPNVPVSVRVTSTAAKDVGNMRYFDTEMLSMSIQGGLMPPGVMIRESPSLQTLGKLHVFQSSDGKYHIDSFFDIFTELSVDGGQNWMPSTIGAGHMALQGDPKPPIITLSPDFPPFPSHYVSPTEYPLLYPNGMFIRDISHEQFLHNDPPPSGGGTQTHSFGSTVRMHISTDGGPSWPCSAPAQVSVSVHNTGGSGGTQTFDTEILQFDISEGNLPPPVRIRESPTKASLGKMTEVLRPDGSYQINSFFDIYTEISTDLGASWTPADGPAYMEVEPMPPPIATTNDNFPPAEGHYISPASWAQAYANGIILKDISHENFSQSSAPPALDNTSDYNFSSTIKGQISMDGGSTFSPVSLAGNTSVRMRHTRDDGSDSFFDTEMLSLDLTGVGVMIRESPSLPSKGRTSIRLLNPGQYNMSSFFDVFTEVTVDGGVTWSPADGVAQMELVAGATEPDSVLICGKKYEDINGNGVQDPGENGLADWTIKATDASDNVVTITTDANGNYCIKVPAPGTYTVEEVQQSGWMQTGGQPYYTLTTVPSQDINSINFGNFRNGSISGTKFNDLNNNGQKDPGEPGLPGWTISLTRDQSPPSNVYPTTGGTEFLGGTMASININLHQAHGGGNITLCAWGNTTVQRANPSGPTPNDSMLTEITLLDMVGTLPSPYPNDTFHIKNATSRRSYGQIKDNSFPAASFFDVFYELDLPASLGGGTYVNYDPTHIQAIIVNTPPSGESYIGVGTAIVNKNNILDTLGIVKIFNHCISSDGLCNGFTCSKQPPNPNPPGTPIGTTSIVTDANGNYSFRDLPRGLYTLHEVPQAGWTQTSADPSSKSIISGSGIVGVDFGNHSNNGEICITKYFDENHNQQRDDPSIEYPMQGFEFNLIDQSNSNVIGQQTTNSLGQACFENVTPGTYKITETPAAGYTTSFPKLGYHEVFIQGGEPALQLEWLNTAALTDTSFRTGSMKDWAYDQVLDGKGKLKAIKGKPDKVQFKINLHSFYVNPPITRLKLVFSMPIEKLQVWDGKEKVVPVCFDSVADPKRQTWNLDFACQGYPLPPIVQIDGIGLKGKLIKLVYTWSSATNPPYTMKGTLPGSKILVSGDTLKQNLSLPMPNLLNVLADMEVVGGNYAFPVVTGAPADSHSVIHKNAKDIIKSLVKVEKSGTIFHEGVAPRCLDMFDVSRKSILKQQKSLPPIKHKNPLFAEVLALQLNVLASQTGKFPPGLDTLIYDNHKGTIPPTNPAFDGKSVREILQQANQFLSCQGDPKNQGLTATDYFDVVRNINGAFVGPIDTIRWSNLKLFLKGSRPLKEVTWLRAIPGSIQPITISTMQGRPSYVPAEFALDQNYPNPFNPMTTIQFSLPEDAVVTLTVYNTLGQEIATLLNQESMDAGSQELEFDASNLPSGVYFYRIAVQGVGDPDEGVAGQSYTSVKKMMLLK